MSPPILIVGAGPAGLTLARSLARRGRAVRVFDAQCRRPERGLGLWGRAQAALRTLGHGDLLDDAGTTLRIPAAAYRNRRGEWLSRSPDTELNRRRVATLRESALLAELEGGLPTGTVCRGAKLIAVEQVEEDATASSPAPITLRFADGTHAEGAAVVGADGPCSSVRRLAFGSDCARAVDTGMVSYGGMLSRLAVANLTSSGGRTDSAEGSAPFEHAFETLSRGRRFACVPLADGGAFWFATLAADALRASAAAAGVDMSAEDGSGRLVVPALRAAYDGWHAPIPRVLHAVACSAAEAGMARVEMRGEGAGDMAGERERSKANMAPLGDQGVLRAERLHVAPPQPSQWWTGRAVLVGDAAHAMPINLAQGAACAIEGAYLLGDALHRHEARREAEDPQAGALSAAFADYQAAHEPRVAQCRAVTAFTHLLAAPASGPMEALRDAMRLVPQPLNGMLFDAALEVSLGNWPERIRRRWPLDTAGG